MSDTRVEALKAEFRTRTNEEPIGIVSVPGRVNIIGEHIDYSGYGVLPMALEQNATLAFSVNSEATLVLKNLDDSKYGDFFMDLSRPWSIEAGHPHWYKYFLCGLRGILDEFPEKDFGSKGLKVLYDGRIPPSAGLSSSSALVVSGALCLLRAHDLSLEPTRLAELCSVSEKYIGTQGGGMDQAIEILAEKGHAKFIEFHPLKTVNVKLPSKAHFIVVNSMTESNKAAGMEFNTRVMECKLAACLLSKALGLDPKSIKTLKNVQTGAKASLEDMDKYVNKFLKSEAFSREELLSNDITRNLIQEALPGDRFCLQKRARHVYAEAQRVYAFREIAESQETLTEMGSLMLKSHESCRDDYECSHPDLDRLVELAMAQGAYGARLTGAGWGGCIIALVPENKVNHFKEVIIESYFKGHKSLSAPCYEDYVFETQPGEGSKSYMF